VFVYEFRRSCYRLMTYIRPDVPSIFIDRERNSPSLAEILVLALASAMAQNDVGAIEISPQHWDILTEICRALIELAASWI